VLALILTAIAGIILGMGMPTTPAYIMMVALLVPALIKLGAPVPAAHMFAFYFAILSAITPPVALAVYASASLAKADLWESGWAAVRVGAAMALANMGPSAAPAIPALVKGLRDPSGEVRQWSARALGEIGSAAESAVPALERAARLDGARGPAEEAIRKIHAR